MSFQSGWGAGTSEGSLFAVIDLFGRRKSNGTGARAPNAAIGNLTAASARLHHGRWSWRATNIRGSGDVNTMNRESLLAPAPADAPVVVDRRRLRLGVRDEPQPENVVAGERVADDADPLRFGDLAARAEESVLHCALGGCPRTIESRAKRPKGQSRTFENAVQRFGQQRRGKSLGHRRSTRGPAVSTFPRSSWLTTANTRPAWMPG